MFREGWSNFVTSPVKDETLRFVLRHRIVDYNTACMSSW